MLEILDFLTLPATEGFNAVPLTTERRTFVWREE
jgi:hypothetical protein